MYLGAKRIPRHFEAVLIYHTQPSEINFIKDEIERYSEAPIKVFLSKTAEPFGGAVQHKARAFGAGQEPEMFAYLNKQRGDIEDLMLKIFTSFDKDASGFIDSAELREVSKELGRELD